MFKLANNGYSMTFENGYTVSVRWSSSHYITGRAREHGHRAWYDAAGHVMEDMATNSIDAEIAVIAPAGIHLQTPFNDTDTVIGWQSPNQVLKIMEWAAAL